MSVSDAQLVQMRLQRTASLRDACAITPAVATGQTAVVNTVACAVASPQGGKNGGGGGSLARQPQFVVTFPWGTRIATADRFVWRNRTLEIAEVQDERTYSTAVHADCIEVTT